VLIGIQSDRKIHLPQIRTTLRLPSRDPRMTQRGHQQSGQDADHRNDHEQFHQRKGTLSSHDLRRIC
jgi:hypothetical protein